MYNTTSKFSRINFTKVNTLYNLKNCRRNRTLGCHLLGHASQFNSHSLSASKFQVVLVCAGNVAATESLKGKNFY